MEASAQAAFNLFRQCMSRFEIVRLCALWDPPSPDRESIPTIVKLLNDHSDVIDALVEETLTTALVGVNDPALAELSPSIEEQAQREAAEARAGIKECIRRVNLLLDSIPLVQALHLWVNGRGFLFDDSRKSARTNAEELWKNCTFNIPSRGDPRKH